MADNNKIQFDIELNEGSVESSFDKIDKRASKSAKESAAVFGEHFQRQEQELKSAIERIVGSSTTAARKSAKESAAVFDEYFKKQEAAYKSAAKESNEAFKDALKKLSGSDELKKSAQESASVFEEAFAKGILKDDRTMWEKLIPQNINSITDIAAGFYLVQSAAAAAGSAISATMDFILHGEREMKLDKKFEILAREAGVVASVMKDELITATAGMIEESKLLQIGVESFVQLGENAKALPQIIEIARKSYAVFGGDIVENTEKINQAIATGQTRQLRALGLYIDSNKAIKDYARELGTVPGLLNENQRQQALLNAVLAKGAEQFKNVAVESGGTEGAFKRLTTATANFFDLLAVKTAQNAKGFLSGGADLITKGIDALTHAMNKSPVERTKERIAQLEGQLASLNSSMEQAAESYSNFGRGGEVMLERNKAQAAALTAEINRLRGEMSAAVEDQRKAERMLGNGPTSTPAKVDDQSDEYIKRKEALNLKLLELDNQLNQSEVQLAQEKFMREQTLLNFEAMNAAQKKQISEQYLQEKANLERFYAENGIMEDGLRQQGREALEAAHLNRMMQLQMNYEMQKRQMFIEGEQETLSVADSVNATLEGMEQQAKEMSISGAKNFKNLGRSMLTSVGQASANAFAAFGQAIAEGENALEAFGKSLLNSLGQMAIQMGAMFILQGIAYTYAGLANGPPLITAGAALAVIGGILSASGGAGPRDVSGGGGSAGNGIAPTAGRNNPINDIIEPEETEPTTPKTEVKVEIHGNVLDRRETGLEIAKILEEQFADQGLVIRGA